VCLFQTAEKAIAHVTLTLCKHMHGAHTIDASQAEHFFDKTCAEYILTRVCLSRTQEILILRACIIKKVLANVQHRDDKFCC
jgi:hypothetical protein